MTKKAHERKSNIIGYKGNTNQHHNDIPLG